MLHFKLVDNSSFWAYNNMKEQIMVVDPKTEAGAYYHAVAKAISTDKFKGAHAINTPQSLVEEVLGKINLRGDILVMFNVEFVVSLVHTYNIAPENITFYSDHDNKSKFCSKLGVKYITNLETDMKFDVVLANPPYQDNDKNPLYYKFHNKVVNDLLKPNGITAFITPDAMAVSLETGIVKGCHNVERREIILINISTDIKKNFFKDVGINNFCYYIIKNNPKLDNVQYTIVTNDGERVGIINPLKPLISNHLIDSILVKCFKFDTNFYKGSWNTAGKSAIKDPNGKDVVALRIDQNGNFETYNVSWKLDLVSKTHKMIGVPKLFITAFGNNAAVAYNHRMVCASEKLLYTVPTSSDVESERLLHLIDCSLKKFLTIVIKARGPYIDFLRHFKGVPLTKKWKDKDLFEYFNLSDEEIECVKSIVNS